MDRKSTRLQQQQKEELAAHERTKQQAAREFATAEELLRFDAAQTQVPPHIAQKLAESLKREPKSGGWWRRWLR